MKLRIRIEEAEKRLSVLREASEYLPGESQAYAKRVLEVTAQKARFWDLEARISALEHNPSNYRHSFLGFKWGKLTPAAQSILEPLKNEELELLATAASGDPPPGPWLERIRTFIRGYQYASYRTAMEAVRKEIERLETLLLRDLKEKARREENERSRREALDAKDLQLDALRAYKAQLEGRTREEAARLRRQVKVSDLCPYCGRELGSDCELDHIWPVSKGGLSTLKNMVFACLICNRLKRDKTLREFVKAQGFDRTTVEERLLKLDKDV